MATTRSVGQLERSDSEHHKNLCENTSRTWLKTSRTATI